MYSWLQLSNLGDKAIPSPVAFAAFVKSIDNDENFRKAADFQL